MIFVYYSLLLFLLSRSVPSVALYSVSSSEPLFPNQTLVSSSLNFELGFFSPNGSNNRYVGMWYKNFIPSKVVWVANRDRPLPFKDQLVSLTIGSDGNLRLLDGARNVVWSTNVSMKSKGSTAALLDTGNLVLRDGDSGNIIWESFDYPTDTLLPGMKTGINVKTGEKQYLVSWKTDIDPSPGNFSLGMTPEVPPQPFIWNGPDPHWRGGQWDKSKFIGIADMDMTYLNGYNVQQDIQQGTTYFSFSVSNNISFDYLFISSEGYCELVDWDDEVGEWHHGWKAPRDRCEIYGTCGPFGICNASALPICRCLDGFTPKSQEEWELGNWMGGCHRIKELQCGRDPNSAASIALGGIQNDYFLKLSQMKLPDVSTYVPFLDAGDCQDWCLNNCSCLAYSYIDTIGCMVWFDELMDIQSFNISGEDLFLRLAFDERENGTGNDQNNIGSSTKIIISLTTISAIIALGAGIYFRYRWRANKKGMDPYLDLAL
ncbi:hypothetical protein CRG98_018035 [Punica granatum]|uniref:Uncharacterized protein n=1 Tax=Punica granatum TaxID=22663 RepID=A0A2I0JYX5_PUNGR|nr:hypothetical protein CRG98_018035 [Punica granatum]